MIGPDLNAGPCLAADRNRHEPDVPKSAHADLGERTSRGEAARRLDTDIQHARATLERVHARRSSAAFAAAQSPSDHARSFIPRLVIVTSRHRIQLWILDLEPGSRDSIMASNRYATAAAGVARAAAAPSPSARSVMASPTSSAASLARKAPCPATTARRGQCAPRRCMTCRSLKRSDAPAHARRAQRSPSRKRRQASPHPRRPSGPAVRPPPAGFGRGRPASRRCTRFRRSGRARDARRQTRRNTPPPRGTGGHGAAPAHDGGHRRPQYPGIDELSAPQPGGVGLAPRHHLSTDDRDDIGRRAAHIEEERVGKRPRHERRTCHPVCGRYAVRLPSRLRRDRKMPSVPYTHGSTSGNA